jgi:hypothetical protein
MSMALLTTSMVLLSVIMLEHQQNFYDMYSMSVVPMVLAQYPEYCYIDGLPQIVLPSTKQTPQTQPLNISKLSS